MSDKSRLALWWWSGSGWQDAAQTCGPASSYQRDQVGRTIRVAICRAGRLSLVGPTHAIFLPLATSSP